MPLRRHPDTDPEGKAESPSRAAAPNILVIDDSEAHRVEIRGLLQSLPGPPVVLEAEDGLQGLKVLMSEPVDLVLCDLEMPRLDGEKLLRMRDSSPGGAHIPFLFLTASALERRTRLLEDGASDAMAKPFHPPELLARVRLHLKIKRLQDELLLKNASLELLSTVDALTGLRTRRFLDESLQVEFLRAARHGTPLVVAMMDVDRFKQVNDEHGHVVGDAVLRRLGEIVRQALRRTDVAGRYGGDEIVIVMPQSTASGATVLAERIRDAVESESFEVGLDQKLQVTASFGVAEYGPDLDTPQALVERADRALYASKTAGRNQVSTA